MQNQQIEADRKRWDRFQEGIRRDPPGKSDLQLFDDHLTGLIQFRIKAGDSDEKIVRAWKDNQDLFRSIIDEHPSGRGHRPRDTEEFGSAVLNVRSGRSALGPVLPHQVESQLRKPPVPEQPQPLPSEVRKER